MKHNEDRLINLVGVSVCTALMHVYALAVALHVGTTCVARMKTTCMNWYKDKFT